MGRGCFIVTEHLLGGFPALPVLEVKEHHGVSLSDPSGPLFLSDQRTGKIHPAPWNEDDNQRHLHRVFGGLLGAILNPMDHEQGEESGVYSGQYE